MKKVLLSLSLLGALGAQAQECSDIFISEYVEGKLLNKAIEIYNPTAEAIDLSVYTLSRFSNGSSQPNTGIVLSGMIAPYDVVVITNGDTIDSGSGQDSYIESELYSLNDLTCPGSYDINSTMFFNGNDAMVISKLGTTTPVDIFGRVGEDPGEGWNDDPCTNYQTDQFFNTWTSDHTLIRKPSVKQGVTSNPPFFNPAAEYDSLSLGTYSNIGMHVCDCLSDTLSVEKLLLDQPSFVAWQNGMYISVSSKVELRTVELLDATGRLVSIEEANSAEYQIAAPKAGIYILRVTSNQGGVSSSKLIVR